MNILAITPFTGSEALVSMTEDCIEGLMQCDVPPGVHVRVLAVNNAASRPIDVEKLTKLVCQQPCAAAWDPIEQLIDTANHGFGVGVNRGIDLALISERWPVDHVLVFNNDLQFPQRDWLVKLLEDVDPPYVLSPRTDITATPEARQPHQAELPAQRVGQVSAFCWLVPMRVIKAIEPRWGWPLFPPQFSNYGSDDATAAILRHIYDATPFKVVHRSWVRHLKAQTANELKIKAGTVELLTELKNWKRAHKLK
jgi:hypothetical protein